MNRELDNPSAVSMAGPFLGDRAPFPEGTVRRTLPAVLCLRLGEKMRTEGIAKFKFTN